MCATFEFRGRIFKPGREVIARSREGVVRPLWAGFARHEILDWWERKGGVLLDLPSARFAERSHESRKLVWDDVPAGFVLRGVMERRESVSIVRIVTRAATQPEVERFGHHRMPLLEAPLHGPPEIAEVEGFLDPEAQRSLF